MVVLGPVEVEIERFEFFMRPNKEILFEKFAHRLHSLKMTFENSMIDGMTHFNISVAVNADDRIRRNKQYSL